MTSLYSELGTLINENFSYITLYNEVSLHMPNSNSSNGAWSSIVVGDESWIGPRRKLLCLCLIQKNYASHAWDNSIVV